SSTARRHGEMLARRRVGCGGSTGTVRRRCLVINCAWSDGRDGGRRAVEKYDDTGIKGRHRGLGSTSRVRMEKSGAM
ncbi:hypothetical protein U1Q18_003446, partial [Sarracenia purpurea var. burkii]